MLLTLPFILLIRGAVFLHVYYQFWPSICILGSIILTTIILFLYFSILYGKIYGSYGDRTSFTRRGSLAFALVFLYAIHGLFYFSGDNVKNPGLKKEINKVHPILRLSISTLIHLDQKLVITDANRQPEDYRTMGLKTPNHSLHYRQKSGYAHALDLRTKGRPEWRNSLVRLYFWTMGFHTLRHVGTADHIHVSLTSHDRPGSI